MTPLSYEREVRLRLERLGWKAKITPRVGDYGADIIAECEDERLVVQCKHYRTSNYLPFKAVQEAVFAKIHFDATRCAIVFSGRMTRQSRLAVAKHGVMAFDLDALTIGCELDRSVKGEELRLRAICESIVAQRIAWVEHDEAARAYKKMRKDRLIAFACLIFSSGCFAAFLWLANHPGWSVFIALIGVSLSIIALDVRQPHKPQLPNPTDNDVFQARRFLNEPSRF